jgi:hypothetical protein
MESEESGMSAPSSDAAAALKALRESRESMAVRAAAPAWYHLGLGAIIGGLTAIQALPVMARFPLMALCMVGLAALVALYKRRSGVWISGMRRGRTRWVTFGALALFGPIYLLCAWLALRGIAPWAPYVGGVVNFAIMTAAGYLWDAVYRAEMRADR